MSNRFQKPGRRNRHFLSAWRRFRDLSQEQLGERVGLSKASISRIESGKTPYTQDVLETMAIVLDTDPASLLAQDPRDEEGVWTLIERLRRLTPSARRRALAVLDALYHSDRNNGAAK